MGLRSDLREVVVTDLKFLAFRSVRPDLKRLQWYFLALGILSILLAGIGRYWDARYPQFGAQIGLFSLMYTLYLATFLWAIILPLRPGNWSLLNVFVFIGMTAPPAFLYAIPIEKYADIYTANAVNYVLLLIVSTWRVALLWAFLRRSAKLRRAPAFFGMMLPLCVILVVLGYFQLMQSAMAGMAGHRNGLQPPNYAGLTASLLGMGALFAFPLVLIGYVVMVVRTGKRVTKEKSSIEAFEVIRDPESSSGDETP